MIDAKSQFKSTSFFIHKIHDSLNFADISFFSKYFKRHIDLYPLSYKNNGHIMVLTVS